MAGQGGSAASILLRMLCRGDTPGQDVEVDQKVLYMGWPLGKPPKGMTFSNKRGKVLMVGAALCDPQFAELRLRRKPKHCHQRARRAFASLTQLLWARLPLSEGRNRMSMLV